MSWVTDRSYSDQKKRKIDPIPSYQKSLSFEQHVTQKYNEIIAANETEKNNTLTEISLLEDEKKLISNNPSRGLIRRNNQIDKKIEFLKNKYEILLSGAKIEEFKSQVLVYSEAYERELQLSGMNAIQEQSESTSLLPKISAPAIITNEVSDRSKKTKNAATLKRQEKMNAQGLSSVINDNYSNILMSGVLKDFIQDVEHIPIDIKVMHEEICEECDDVMTLESRSSTLVCSCCGHWRHHLDATSSHMAYGEEVEFTAFAYLRLNHYNERLTYSQAKEITKIKDSDIRKVMDRLIEKKITDVSKITMEMTYLTAKELSMRHVYKQNTQLWCKITGNPPPRMTPEQEERLRTMFRAVNRLWEKYKPEERKNFLSYNYCLYKFCELLGLSQKNLFKLLKGDKKLEKQDEIFKRICEDPELNWEFIPSKND